MVSSAYVMRALTPYLALLALLLVCGAAQAESIPLIREHGTFVVPVVINDKMTLNFTIDSGASDVSIPADVFSTLTRTGTVTKSDFLDKQTYELADGSRQTSQRFRIRTLRIGSLELSAVIASVAPSAGTLLLGQSFLSRLKSWSIDNDRQLLVFNESTNRDAAPTAVRPELRAGTGIAQPPVPSPRNVVFAGAAGAADSPAQVGYCVESLRELRAMNSATTQPDGVTPQWETDAFRQSQQEEDSILRPIFEQWRILRLSLLSQPGAPVLEMMRGQNQAKTDGAQVEAKSAAAVAECIKTPDAAACLTEKTKADKSDPTVIGMQRRAAPCMRGPSL
jgi:clan AA aspartic protease (TIGR02281 family)